LFTLTRERRLKRGGGKVELLGTALNDKQAEVEQPLSLLCEAEEAGMLLAVIDEFTRAENGTDADAAGDRDRGHIPYHHRFRLMLKEEKL
jgi:hypothetical protein